DGTRNALGNRPPAPPLADPAALLARLRPRVLLLDAHRPEWSGPLAAAARAAGIPIVADLGSPTPAAHALAQVADHLVASEAYAAANLPQPDSIISIVTRGERGLAFNHPAHGAGERPAFNLAAVDTNGAGDAFHGTYALGLARGTPWPELLRRASACGALACTRPGSWSALATAAELENFLLQHADHFTV
ncbi:MAG: PfkB family carbohydrate kinase, partial [Verrucomicrobiota bacterium]